MVNSGEGVSLTCVVSGSPLPNVIWRRRGEIITNDTSNAVILETTFMQANYSFVQSVLDLCPVASSDAGEYTCFTENDHGNHSAVFEIVVIQSKL